MATEDEAVPAILFEEEAVKTAKLFGRNGEVQVVFAGDQARTDGKTIVLPALNHGQNLDPATIKVARGYVDHEAAEILYIDQRLAKVLRDGNKHDSVLTTMFNAMGDFYLESRAREMYPGAEKNLSATADRVAQRFIETEAKKTPTWADEIEAITPLAFTWGFREAEGYAGIDVRDNYSRVNPRIRGLVKKYIERARADLLPIRDKTQATQKAFDIAVDIVRELRAKDPEVPPEEARRGATTLRPDSRGGKGGKGSGMSDVMKDARGGDRIEAPKKPKAEEEISNPAKPKEKTDEEKKAEEKAKAESEISAEEESPEHHKTEDKSESPDRGEGDITIEADHEAGEGSVVDEIMPSGGEAVPGVGAGGTVGIDDFKVLRNNLSPFTVEVAPEAIFGKPIHDTNKYRPLSTSFDTVHTLADAGRGKIESVHGQVVSFNGGDILANPEGTKNYMSVLGHATGPISVMKRKLERALVSKLNRAWMNRLEEGRLDSRDLVRAYNAKPDVFKKRLEAPALDTAVEVVIDLSGSMSGRKTDLTQQAAVMFSESLERTGVAYEITGFNNGHQNYAARKFQQDAERNGEMWSRWQPIDIWVFKGFEDTLRKSRVSIGNLHYAVGGDNADGESIMYCWRRLMRRSEKRKVMLVLSDGYPATHTSFSEGHLNKHLRYCVKVIEDSGVDLIGIGIMSTAVSQFYPKHVVCNKIADLPGTIMDKVARALLGENFQVDNSKLLKAQKM